MWKVLFLDLPHMGIVLSIKTLYILLFPVCISGDHVNNEGISSPGATSGKRPDYDKAIYSFKFYKISIITIRITLHQIKLDKVN